jgi:hypothetical protein
LLTVSHYTKTHTFCFGEIAISQGADPFPQGAKPFCRGAELNLQGAKSFSHGANAHLQGAKPFRALPELFSSLFNCLFSMPNSFIFYLFTLKIQDYARRTHFSHC